VQVNVLQVFDPTQVLLGTVAAGNIYDAVIRYERLVPDEDPDPTLGRYHMNRFWYGLTAIDASNVDGGFHFRAHPMHLDVVMTVQNSSHDRISIRSLVNLPIAPLVTVDEIEWVFDDSTGTALVNDDLPASLSVASFAERTLEILGHREDTLDPYHITARVMGSEEVLCAQGDPVERAVCVDLQAVVDAVNDPGNLLQGSVQVSQVLQGSYTYNRSCDDANALPNIGEYFHNAMFYGMVVDADGITFFTDNTLPALNVYVTSGAPPSPGDGFSVVSPNNAALPSGARVTRMGWELWDDAGDAITTAELPAGAPQIANWDYNALSIEGNDGMQPPEHTFELTATVTQASSASCFSGPGATDAGNLDPSTASMLPLAAAAPNPFHGTTAIRYRITQPSDRIVRIYDVAGRQVRALVAWQDALGPVTLRWDGTDDGGRAVARGTYVLRIGAGRHAPAGRLVYMGR
jgi:hypothetical protein